MAAGMPHKSLLNGQLSPAVLQSCCPHKVWLGKRSNRLVSTLAQMALSRRNSQTITAHSHYVVAAVNGAGSSPCS